MKILFISHDASLTGAPIVLIHHLKSFKINYPTLLFDIYLMQSGVLLDEFQKVGTKVIESKNNNLIFRMLLRLTKSSFIKYFSFKRLLKNKQYKIVYGNTVVSSSLLKIAKEYDRNTLTVLHVHELHFGIQSFVGLETFKNTLAFIDNFIAASQAVKVMLVKDFNISPDKIFLHYPHILVNDYNTVSKLPVLKSGFKIVGCGTPDWRKGIDLFIQIAFQVKSFDLSEKFHFYWIGGRSGSVEFERAMYDIRKLNLEDKITLLENVDQPSLYMKACDIFFLSSREDPFPLVCLEAASVGKPIICFNKAGGMIEFVDSTNGWVMDYLNLQETSLLIKHLIQSPEIVLEKGKAAYSKVQQYDISIGGEKLYKFISGLTS